VWGSPEFTAQLQVVSTEWDSHYFKTWRQLTKVAVDHIYSRYDLDARAAKKSGLETLTYANFSKSPASMMRLLKTPTSGLMKKLARQALD
jgi:hypothetical protein